MRRRQGDLLAAVAIAAVAAVVVSLVPGLHAMKIALSLPLLLCLPGYSLTAALFPPAALEPARRLLLSLALSIALAVVIGLVLNLLPFGLRLASWAISLVVVIAGACAVAAFRRRDRSAPTGIRVPRLSATGLALLFAAAAIIGAAVAFARTPLPAKRVQGYTALWLLPVGAAGADTVRVGAASGELETTRYRLVILVRRRPAYVRRLVLRPGQRVEQTLELGRLATAPHIRIDALLYRENDPRSIYRRASFWTSKRRPGQ
jgi:Protein of unknown function (DUF1616)